MDSKETPSPKKSLYNRWWFWVIVSVVALMVIGALSDSNPTPDATAPAAADNTPPQTICDTDQQALKQQAQKVDYKQLSKEPDKYSGTLTTFTGKVLQIEQNGGEGVLRLSVTNLGYGVWSSSDILYVTYHKATDALEDDIVTVTGNLTGSQTYTSQANYQITIPSMDVCSVTKASAAKKTVPAPASSGSSQASQLAQQQTYTTPSGAVVNNSGSVVTAPPNPAASWHTVGTFGGSGTQNTNPITIKGTQWRINWSATADNSDTFCAQNGCVFNIELFNPGSDSQVDYIQSDVYTSKSDSGNFYTDGTFYLKVDPYKISNWTMTVEDYY